MIIISSDMNSKEVGYQFYAHEQAAIVKGLVPIINALKKQRQKLLDHPKNEGQATWDAKISPISEEIRDLEGIVQAFS